MKRLLELDLLRTLVMVSEQESFTKAAELLNRTQAAVSMQVRRLEELCGAVLIARSKREFRLTDEGITIVRHARRMLELNDETVADLAPDVVAGVVRLAVPDTEAVRILPSLLARFADSHPRVQVQLQSGVRPYEIVETLEGINFDLMIALEPADAASGLVLSRERAVWATSVRSKPELRNPLPLALLHEGSLLRTWALSSLSQTGRNWHEAYSSASGLSLVAALEEGFAVGAIRETSLNPALRELTPEEGFEPLPSFQVTLVRARRGLGRAAEALRMYLAEHLLTEPEPLALAS